MSDLLIQQTSIPLLEKMAAFTERRQEILAENLANLDTPGYKMRDLPQQKFQQALAAAIRIRSQPTSPASGSESQNPASSFQAMFANPEMGAGGQGSMPVQFPSLSLGSPESPSTSDLTPPSIDQLFPRSMLTPEVADSQQLVFRDGNNRSIENLVMQITKNNMQHTFAIETMRSQMGMLETVLNG
jgi:flagellar basal-body rod protein FlgB